MEFDQSRLVKKRNHVVASIIVDTRERSPWAFNLSNLPSGFTIDTIFVDKLDAGDYALVGHDLPSDNLSIIIERKHSMIEFLGNVGQKWKRFREELKLLAEYENAYIIIEDDMRDMLDAWHSTRGYVNYPPEFVLNRISQIESEFGIHVHLLTNKVYAERMACYLFRNTILKDRLLDE